MRFHVVGLPQSCTTKAWSLCGFSQKTMRFCWMLKSLGHTVNLYAGEKNDAPCDEHVVCFTMEDRKKICAGKLYVFPDWNRENEVWKRTNKKVADEINKRKQPGDFVCILGGNCQQELETLVPDLKVVEYGIGYTGWACKWLVFESHAWRSFMDGMILRGQRPNPYTYVIPSFYDEQEFEWQRERKGYALFVGRINTGKGIELACEACAKAGMPLKVIGHGETKLVGHGAEYLGAVPENHRNRLMAEANVLFAPTLSFEPFGNVACEAQMCGTPVISTNFGGFVETVSHKFSGYRIWDVDDAAKAVGMLDKLAPAEAIRARAINWWSIRTVRDEYQEYFEKLSRLP